MWPLLINHLLLIAAGEFFQSLLSGSGIPTSLLDEKIVQPDCSHWNWLQIFLFHSSPSVSLSLGSFFWSHHIAHICLYIYAVIVVTAVQCTHSCVHSWDGCLVMYTVLWKHRKGNDTFLSCLILHIDNLLIDYQFTFSLIQEDDNHYTAINFMASPEQVRKRSQSATGAVKP